MPGTESLWYKDADLLRGLCPGLLRRQRRRRRRPDRPDLQARLPPGAGRRLPLADAHLRLAPEGRRLRHRRFPPDPPHDRHRRRLRGADQGRPRPRHPDHRRPRGQPHVRPASLVPGGAPRPDTRPSATTTSGATPTRSTRGRGSSSATPRRPTGPGTRSPASTSGTASTAISPTSITTTPPSSRRCSTSWRFWLDRGIDGFRVDAVPYLYRARGDELREPARDPRLPQEDAAVRRRPLPGHAAAGRGQPVAQRPAALLRQRRRVPHGVQLPADAPALHGHPPRGPAADHRDHEPDARDPARPASGPCSCATTTS